MQHRIISEATFSLGKTGTDPNLLLFTYTVTNFWVSNDSKLLVEWCSIIKVMYPFSGMFQKIANREATGTHRYSSVHIWFVKFDDVVDVVDDYEENFVINFCHVFPCCCGWLLLLLLWYTIFLLLLFLVGLVSFGVSVRVSCTIVMRRIFNLILWHLFLIKLNVFFILYYFCFFLFFCYTNAFLQFFLYMCVYKYIVGCRTLFQISLCT